MYDSGFSDKKSIKVKLKCYHLKDSIRKVNDNRCNSFDPHVVEIL